VYSVDVLFWGWEIWFHTQTHKVSSASLCVLCLCMCVCMYVCMYVCTGCFMSCGNFCKRWFHRSFWQGSFCQRVSYSQWLWCQACFLILIITLLWTTCRTPCNFYMLCDLWMTFNSAIERLISSIPKNLFTTGLRGFLVAENEISDSCFKHRSE
jgi:hypothetical protein